MNKLRKIFLFLITVLSQLISFGQINYFKIINTSAESPWMKSLVESNDKHFILLGNERNFNYESKNIFLIKVNNAGDTVWTRRIFSSDKIKNKIEGVKIYKTNDPNIFLISSLQYLDTYNSDVSLILINKDGQILNQKTFDLSSREKLIDVSQSNDGFLITTNQYFDSGNKSNLIKTNFLLDSLWSKEIPIHHDLFQSIFYNDNLYISTFKMKTLTGGAFTYFWNILKVNPKGDTVWYKEVGYGYQPHISSLFINSKGNIVNFTNTGVFEITESGNVLNANGNLFFYHDHLLITNDDNFIMTYTYSQLNSSNIEIKKFDSQGNILWKKNYKASIMDNCRGKASLIASDGDIVTIGEAEHSESGLIEFDPLILKTKSDGSIITSIFEVKQERENKNYYLSPSGILTFKETLKVNTEINISNKMGINLFSKKMDSNSKIIDLSFLHNGVYLIQIKSDDSVYLIKFIKE